MQHLFHAVRTLESRQRSTDDSVELLAKDADARYKLLPAAEPDGLSEPLSGALPALRDLVAGAVQKAGGQSAVGMLEGLDKRMGQHADALRSEFAERLDELFHVLADLDTRIGGCVTSTTLREAHRKLGKRLEALELVTSIKEQHVKPALPPELALVGQAHLPHAPGAPPKRSPVDQVHRNLSVAQNETMREAMQAINWQARLAQFGSPRT